MCQLPSQPRCLLACRRLSVGGAATNGAAALNTTMMSQEWCGYCRARNTPAASPLKCRLCQRLPVLRRQRRGFRGNPKPRAPCAAPATPGWRSRSARERRPRLHLQVTTRALQRHAAAAIGIIKGSETACVQRQGLWDHIHRQRRPRLHLQLGVYKTKSCYNALLCQRLRDGIHCQRRQRWQLAVSSACRE